MNNGDVNIIKKVSPNGHERSARTCVGILGLVCDVRNVHDGPRRPRAQKKKKKKSKAVSLNDLIAFCDVSLKLS